MESSTRRLLAGATLLSLLMLWSTAGSSAAAPVPVGVGVVLDLRSETGRKSLTCISMALDDFYLKHPNHTSRVDLRVRDSRGELATAAYAAEELMNKNAQVQAIISPDHETTGLFASIATRKRADIPILSLSATSPASGSSLVRTSADSASQQAAPVAAILDSFAWRAAVLLHEDSFHGISILPALVHAFHRLGHGHAPRGVTDSVAVPADAVDSRLDAALLAARRNPARVYVVHMPAALAARLFRRATAAGMMSEGHVWIATTGIGNAADCLPSPGDVDYMQGVVSLRPYVHATGQARSFSRRFNARFRQQATDDEDTSLVPVWLLWLYDTAWAIATAAEATTRGTAIVLLDALLNTTFLGVAGEFRLIDGQLQIPAYEIVNVVGKGARTVGFWTPDEYDGFVAAGIISTSLNPRTGNKLKQILWPGETATVPTGWSESPDGGPLRVAVPVKRGFSQFVNISRANLSTKRVTITGFCIDVFHAVMTTKLAYSLAYQYVPVDDTSTGSYDRLVNLVYDKKADVLVGDVTITASRMKLVSFTVPFADSGWSMIVAEEDKNNNNMWIFLKPLTPGLWFTSLAFFFFTGFVVWAIEHRINPRFRGTPWKQFGVLFYFAFSTLVFSHKEKLESNLSKLVVIIWMFAVLILTQSYAASLSSMLTVRQLQPAINLLTERDYVGYQNGSFVADFLKEMGFDEARLKGYNTMEEYADALKRGSANGGVTAIFDELPYLRLFLSRYCEGYAMAGPTYKSGGFGFAFPMGSPLVLDVSRAILELAEEEKLARIENKWFGHPGACVGKSSSSPGDESSRLGLSRFGGLFVVNAVVSGLVLLVHFASFVISRRERGGEHITGAAARDPGPGALLWQRLRRRFDAFDGPRGDESLAARNGSGTEEPNCQGLDTGGAEQEAAATRDFFADDASYSGREAASAHVSEEILAPLGGRPFDRADGPGTSSLMELPCRHAAQVTESIVAAKMLN